MENKSLLISFLQTFGIILVVVGHSFYGSEQELVIRTWIYSFHMPLFMFISGYLLRYSVEKKNLPLAKTPLIGKGGGFIVKKAYRLLVPYVVISTIAFFPKALLGSLADRPVDISLAAYIKMLVYPWDNVIIFFWFLPTLFLVFVITMYGARALKNIKFNIWPLLLPALLLMHMFNPLADVKILNIGGVVNYILYFALGYYVCRERIEQVFEKSPFSFCISTLALSLILLFVPDFPGKDVLSAANGIVMSISLGYIYIKRNMTFLQHLYGASYAIYIFSWFPQVLSQQVFLKLTGAPWPVSTCLAIMTGLYIPLLIYKWIVMHKNKKYGKIIAFLTGQ
ncbi:acyltransferase family protein [uncultured Alistipes sp.]|jgi:putative membrane protein|uniref:acyltransferase family protein n=1 Tax=uncultured Alistipes sp. TaxID=538949 RepID=UPI0025F7BF18|nr:acyltransferase family protein [uncultured Alistipes sp.]